MASTTTTTTNSLNPSTIIQSFPTQPYQPMLQESVHHFLTQLQAGISDFTHFNLMFSRLIQTMPSPPIEVIWFYTAVNFHTHKNRTHKDDNFGVVSCLKELFQLLVSCSGPCSSSLKRVALLAPLLFELCNFVSDLKVQSESGFLRYDNVVVVVKEVGCLVEGLVSFISLCCCEGVDDHDDSLPFSPCFVDLVRVWTVRRRESEFGFEDDFRIFFPMVNDEVGNGLLAGDGNGVGFLAGVVMCQAFLLSLCFKCGFKEPQMKQDDDVRNLAVNTITGFRSCYFFDILLKVLLDSSLPVTSLMSSADEVQLREVLFDAIILVDYPFFNPGCGIHLCSLHLNSLASTWLFVADKAMQFVRNNGDQTRVISYTKAFCKSFINSQLLRWVSNQIGMAEDAFRPNLSTPAAFVDWLVQLRSQASVRLNSEFAMLLEKALHCKSEMTCEQPFSEAEGNNKDYTVDQNAGEGCGVHGNTEMIEAADGTVSGCNANFAAIDGCRKRKGGNSEGGIRVKLLKYHTHGSPIKNCSPFQNEVGLIRRI